MTSISDEELFMLTLEENEDAKNELFKRYEYIIDVIIKKYRKTLYKLGLDKKDVYSEALYGFSDALNCYNQDKPASIPTFITLCVERRVKSYFIKASRIKNKMLMEAYSLDYVYDNFGIPLVDIISDNSLNDPLSNMAKEESYNELLENIKTTLSEFEYSVFTFMANNIDYIEIANILDKSPKQIDNTMQRIKIKLKKILENRKNA